ncbi:hypothetical protein VUJ46_04130 [Chryseobacterium sp. MYb264]|uniref:hypothetical protein n=1 Tax=Chryseobacterium sp. MYb264 TaxID=2745153 RepID=UPI002E13D68B|nr:hypothetical protein VUJ46_04130 [Chryseobacterium sp. MYb264]
MKKLVLCLAIATVAVSCKKIQAGGNKNIIKLEESAGADRYSEDVQGGGEGHGHGAAAHKEETTAEKHETVAPKADSATAAKPAEAEAPKAEH